MLHFDQLPEITGGKIVSPEKAKPLAIEHLLIDSRKLLVPATSLFFAIRGDRHDGHRFIADLYQKGVRLFVVEQLPADFDLPEASILLVTDSLRALQAVAAWHRQQFQIPVIGITGSNGKTIVKEWLATLLSKWYQVVKSPRSYNSQVGVPLSVWQLNASHTIGVFEAGISQLHEMEFLEKVIQPTIGIFTNIGTAHDEGFANRQQKIAEKAKLFEQCEAVIYCEEHTEVHEYLTTHLPKTVKLVGWKGRELTKGEPHPQPLPIREGSVDAVTYGTPFYHTSPEKWKTLKEFGRQNRKNPTSAEQVLWEYLRKQQVLGVKFRRQHSIDDFIVDFVSLEYRLIIEVDGEIHTQQKEYDALRTEYLNAAGFEVIRFTNAEVLNDIQTVINKIKSKLDQKMTKTPLPNGEGLGVGLLPELSSAAEAENLQHCIALLQYLGIPENQIQQQLSVLQPVSMRLELKQGIRGCYVIDDTYNNDLAGLQIALDFLSNQQQRSKKTVILSDVLESGEPEAQLYAKIAAMLHNKHIDRLIGIGEVISRNAGVFNIPTILFPSTEKFLGLPPVPKKAVRSLLHGRGSGEALFSNELILVKGARTFRFERIVQQLQQKTHGTVLEINLDAIAHNLNYYRSRIKPQTKLMAMVKAFAYGSGSAEIASLLQFHRVDYLAVAYADEGVILRENGITLPIMVMNPSAETFSQLIDFQLEPEIYSPRILREFLDFLEETDASTRIHLKVETGMHRLGFEQDQIPDLIQTVKQNPRVQVAAIFSHLASSDNLLQREYTLQQIETFQLLSSQITKALGYEPIRHIVNSAGISNFPEAQFDMVRLGIGLYGVGASETEQEHLQTVGTLKTTISQIKPVKADETIGYGRRGKLPKDGSIATIAIGYADGFDRRFSVGNGKVWINGQLAPVVGSVCMDMTMVDVSDMDVQEGDEVVIFGESLPIQQLAQWANTIPYELMTGISERVKRVFFAE